MKSALFLFLTVAQTALAAANSFPIPRLRGHFNYQDHFLVTNVRRAETVRLGTDESDKRIKDLRKQGYTCIRNSLNTRLCTINWGPQPPPVGMDTAVQKRMADFSLDFEGSDAPPLLVHDGSTTQEWNVIEKIRVWNQDISVYRVVRNSAGKVFIAFPVNNTQPVGVLNFHNENQLGWNIVGSHKDTDQSTVTFFIEAFIEKQVVPE